MAAMRLSPLLLLVQVLDLTFTSNIYPVPLSVIYGNTSLHFGHKVLQFRTHDATWIIVGAPGDQNNTGKLFQCDPRNGSCETIEGTDTFQTPHLGLTLESDPVASRLIACGPGLPHECEKSMFLNGFCYILENGVKRQEITPGYQECVKGKVDLVFLFDGSGSMSTEDFMSIISFMTSVMEGLQNTSVQFAAVQFSTKAKTEFNFADFQRLKDPQQLMKNVTHMTELTFTFRAIKHVIEDIFNTSSGSRLDAKKVIIIITDGEATDGGIKYHPPPIQTANERGIIRYIIGVGSNFKGNTAKDSDLEMFASHPSREHIKVLKSFSELQTEFNDIQKKIFAIEGTSGEQSFIMEMSSGGFSAALSPDLDVLGAVGAHDWAGGLIELRDNLRQENFINISSLSEDMKYAYLGYSLKLIQQRDGVLYAAGAPRYRYVGKVVVFAVNATSEEWTEKQEILGTQIGSYFGSELCAVDLDSDHETDVLLIAAPLYHEDRRGGWVHVCPFTKGSISCSSVLKGEVGHPFARFGAAMAALKDLNGDGLADVAIGAPLENGDTGAVYIYHGQEGGISPRYSQRIAGTPGLRYFGQSLHGIMDLSGDGLTDIAVGAHGQVAILSSRPIVNVSASMSFDPPEILLKIFECSEVLTSRSEPGFNISLCFNTSLVTSTFLGQLSANLTYQLELDANRIKNRVVFQNGKRDITDTLDLSEGEQCITRGIFLPSCIEDYVSAIKVSLNMWLQDGADPPRRSTSAPILNPLYNATSSYEIPFEKNCGSDRFCEADLKVFFDASGDQQLIVKESSWSGLNVMLDLRNQREDAYRATLHLTYPAGLSFRKATVLKSSTKTTVSCHGLQELDAMEVTVRSLICNVSHPIFKRDTEARLHVLLDVISNSSWKDFVDMEASFSSDFENRTFSDKASLHIPVLYAINVIGVGLEDSTKYVNFTAGKQELKSVTHSYKVLMMEPKSHLPSLTITIAVPVTFSMGLWWEVERVRADSNVTCRSLKEEEITTADIEEMMNHTERVKVFHCSVDQMDMIEFHVEGHMSIPKETQQIESSILVKTFLWIHFNTSRYKSLYQGEDFSRVQVTTQVEFIVPKNYLILIIGSSVGGLLLLLIIILILWKFGFFNRAYKAKMECKYNGEGDGEVNEEPEHSKEEGSEDNGFQQPLNGNGIKE